MFGAYASRRRRRQRQRRVAASSLLLKPQTIVFADEHDRGLGSSLANLLLRLQVIFFFYIVRRSSAAKSIPNSEFRETTKSSKRLSLYLRLLLCVFFSCRCRCCCCVTPFDVCGRFAHAVMFSTTASHRRYYRQAGRNPNM